MIGANLRDRRVWVGLAFVLLSVRGARADFSAFPLVHSQHGPTSGTSSLWAPWPLVEVTRTTDTLTYGLHPLFSWYKEQSTGESALHVVWPIVRRTFRPSTFKGENWRVFYVLPLLYLGRGEREGKPVLTRYLLPIYYQGRQWPGREHFILFPFVWYARDARLIWPLFPTRPQTFVALWPLYGDFRGYWNRDRIQFLLWPVFVWTQKGRGSEAVYIESFLWPFFAVYSGQKYSGFRIFPLVSWVRKQGAYTRSYWLWPLGKHASGLAPDGKTTQTLTYFLPFYGNYRAGNTSWKLYFPFYGVVRTGKRVSQGYVLAIYNTTKDYRAGTVERRILWFVLRWKRLMKPSATAGGDAGTTPSLAQGAGTTLFDWDEKTTPTPQTGWALFPIYGKMASSTRVRSFMLWPFYTHNWDRYREFEFDRRYFVPFYSSQTRRWNDGTISRSRFLFPLFRSSVRRDGAEHRHYLHLWWYDQVDGLDRNYAPLWTFFEKNWNERTGAKQVRVMKALYQYDRRPDGWTRKAFNFLVFSTERSPDTAHTSLLWGLLGYRRQGEESSVRLLWLIKI